LNPFTDPGEITRESDPLEDNSSVG